jgi:hypothetical protein
MVPLVAFPELVQHYAPFFRPVFSAEAFIEFERYLSGLIVSENKTVDGINRLCVVQSRHQSSLNRLLTASPFMRSDLNESRLSVMDSLPGTQYKRNGVLSVDDTLLTHYGEHCEQIAFLREPHAGQYGWAHNLVTVHYSDAETDYPLRFQRWKPPDVEKLEHGLRAAGIQLKESKRALKETAPHQGRHYWQGVRLRHLRQPEVAAWYETKATIAEQLLHDWVNTYPERKPAVTFDGWYTQPAFCRYLDKTLRLPYVGTLGHDDEVVLPDVPHTRQRLDQFAAQLKQTHQDTLAQGGPPLFKPICIRYKHPEEHYFSYCATERLADFGRQRLVINHSQADLSDQPVYYISNRLFWQSPGITRIRRSSCAARHSPGTRAQRAAQDIRWPVDVYQEEGKAEGLDQYQVRDFQATAASSRRCASSDTWLWWLSCTAYCVQPNKTRLSDTHCNVSSSWSWRAVRPSGGGRPRRNVCGAWRS